MSGYKVFSVETCGNCKYFRRHYICRDTGDYLPLQYGHCVYPRLKKRRSEEHCVHWTPTKTESDSALYAPGRTSDITEALTGELTTGQYAAAQARCGPEIEETPVQDRQ